MDDTRFTPGPYRVGLGPQGGFSIEAGDAILCQRAPWSFRADESAANGYLFAAAPELYAAIQALIDHIKYGEYRDKADLRLGDVVPHFERATAALALARGEQP